jgi:hypothetical protein
MIMLTTVVDEALVVFPLQRDSQQQEMLLLKLPVNPLTRLSLDATHRDNARQLLQVQQTLLPAHLFQQ